MIDVAIIEDEETSRMLLKIFLVDYIKNINIIGEADSVETGICMLSRVNPDIIFFDVQILGGNCFDILSKIECSDSLVVFITSYSEYSLRAIKFQVFDYILKPIVINQLKELMSRAKNEIAKRRKIKQLLDPKILAYEKEYSIILKDNHVYRRVAVDSVLCVQANGSYSVFVMADNSKILIAKSLKQIEEEFSNLFFRTHRSYLVNLNHVKDWKTNRGGVLTLSNDQKIPISFRRKTKFLNAVFYQEKE